MCAMLQNPKEEKLSRKVAFRVARCYERDIKDKTKLYSINLEKRRVLITLM